MRMALRRRFCASSVWVAWRSNHSLRETVRPHGVFVYADFTEEAMWRFVVGLVTRTVPDGDPCSRRRVGVYRGWAAERGERLTDQ
jgi:hypothetical protein